MLDKRIAPTILCAVCCTLSIVAGCGGGSGSGGGGLVPLTGKAIHEVAGGPCCNPPTDTPLALTLLSFHTFAGAEAAQTRTDGAGAYSVMLPPGTYAADLVDRANQPFYNAVQPLQIQVTANTPSQVDIKFEEDVP